MYSIGSKKCSPYVSRYYCTLNFHIILDFRISRLITTEQPTMPRALPLRGCERRAQCADLFARCGDTATVVEMEIIKACPTLHIRQQSCRKREQIVAEDGNFVAVNDNKLLPETATLTGAATMLPFRATICCRFRQQFVAWCGQALKGYIQFLGLCVRLICLTFQWTSCSIPCNYIGRNMRIPK